MNAAETRRLAQRWMDEVWNQRMEATVDELLTEQSVGHACGGPDVRGPADFRAFRDSLFEAFGSHLRLQVLDMVAEGDQVAVRWRVTGKHCGSLMGCAATQKPVDFWGLTWLRFDNGVLVEGWDAWNPGALLQELQAPAAEATA